MWLLFEVLRRLRDSGAKLPLAVVVTGFPGPDIPMDLRPCPRTDGMADADFQSAVREWDPEHFEGPAKVVFNPGTWEDFKYMRSDFACFETYELKDQVEPFDLPFLVITTTGDCVVKDEH